MKNHFFSLIIFLTFLQLGIDKMLEVLYDNNYNLNENLYYIKDYKAEHFESAWANRFHYPLLYFFQNK